MWVIYQDVESSSLEDNGVEPLTVGRNGVEPLTVGKDYQYRTTTSTVTNLDTFMAEANKLAVRDFPFMSFVNKDLANENSAVLVIPIKCSIDFRISSKDAVKATMLSGKCDVEDIYNLLPESATQPISLDVDKIVRCKNTSSDLAVIKLDSNSSLEVYAVKGSLKFIADTPKVIITETPTYTAECNCSSKKES